QRLHGEAQSRELAAQRLESFQLVAQNSGAFVLEPLARLFHLAPKVLDRPVVRSIEKRPRQSKPLIVLLGRTPADAWSEALLHLEPNAARCARESVEQLGLVREIHLLVGGAVAK